MILQYKIIRATKYSTKLQKTSSVLLVLLNLGTENENINHDADDLRKQFYGISE